MTIDTPAGPESPLASSDGRMAREGLRPPRFRFVDVFAGIGGMRAGLEMAGGQCVFMIENDPFAVRTYRDNWDADVAGDAVAGAGSEQLRYELLDVNKVNPDEIGPYDLLAAGFPCQPFSLAGVVKKEALRRERMTLANEVIDEELVKRSHGFHDPISGNLFFQIIRLIGGPWNLPQEALEREAIEPDSYDLELEKEGDSLLQSTQTLHQMPPVLLLENVRNLLSHDKGRTFRIIRRRLIRSGYWVSHRVISGRHWVPQDRRRIFIVALRRDLFDRPFTFPDEPPGVQGLTEDFLEHDPAVLEAHRLTPGVWAALEKHRARHLGKHNGFGYAIAPMGKPTRTLSARYYKDGAEILIWLPDYLQREGKAPVRRLTLSECARLMGFVRPYLRRDFIPNPSSVQAYRQFGNSVIVPQVAWLADALATRASAEFTRRRNEEPVSRTATTGATGHPSHR